MSFSYPYRPLAEVVAGGLISDGDWIESKDQDPDGSVRLIQLADIGDGRYLNKSKRFLTKETASRLKCTSLRQGDIIVARMPDPIGRACIYPGDAKEAITVVDVCILRVDEKTADARWLMSAINADFTRRAIERAAGGTTRTRISRGSLEKLLMPCPPLPEQQKIAAILTAVDDKLDVIARQIDATQTLKQGLMQTLFSRGVGTQDADGRWVPHTEFRDSELGVVVARWNLSTIGATGDLKNGINKSKEAFGKGHQLVNLMDVFGKTSVGNSTFGLVETSEKERKEFSLRRGDILFVRSSVKPSGVGLTSLVKEDIPDAVYSGFLIRFRLLDDTVSPGFLKHYFLSEAFRTLLLKKSTVSANTNINQVALMSLPVIIPSLAEQEYITSVFDGLEEKIEFLAQKQKHFQTLKRGLMQKLLTGEWRVSVDPTTGT